MTRRGRHDEDEPDWEPPTSLQAALDEVLRGLRAPTTRQLGGVFQGWADVVGPTIAAHATPVSLERGRLVVEVDDPGWATQLRFLEADLVQRLAAVAGRNVVTTIELRVSRAARGSGRRGAPPGGSGGGARGGSGEGPGGAGPRHRGGPPTAP